MFSGNVYIAQTQGESSQGGKKSPLSMSMNILIYVQAMFI